MACHAAGDVVAAATRGTHGPNENLKHLQTSLNGHAKNCFKIMLLTRRTVYA